MEQKIYKFRGLKLEAIPEISKNSCEGCILHDKGCYHSRELLKVCREGYIFKEHKNKK